MIGHRVYTFPATQAVLEAELQARWQNGRTGRRGSARHISGWQNPLYTRQNLFEGGFGLLAFRRIFQHIKIIETSVTLHWKSNWQNCDGVVQTFTNP